MKLFYNLACMVLTHAITMHTCVAETFKDASAVLDGITVKKGQSETSYYKEHVGIGGGTTIAVDGSLDVIANSWILIQPPFHAKSGSYFRATIDRSYFTPQVGDVTVNMSIDNKNSLSYSLVIPLSSPEYPMKREWRLNVESISALKYGTVHWSDSTATQWGENTLIYTVNPASMSLVWEGVDSFQYRVEDEHGNVSAWATVRIEINAEESSGDEEVVHEKGSYSFVDGESSDSCPDADLVLDNELYDDFRDKADGSYSYYNTVAICHKTQVKADGYLDVLALENIIVKPPFRVEAGGYCHLKVGDVEFGPHAQNISLFAIAGQAAPINLALILAYPEEEGMSWDIDISKVNEVLKYGQVAWADPSAPHWEPNTLFYTPNDFEEEGLQKEADISYRARTSKGVLGNYGKISIEVRNSNVPPVLYVDIEGNDSLYFIIKEETESVSFPLAVKESPVFDAANVNLFGYDQDLNDNDDVFLYFYDRETGEHTTAREVYTHTGARARIDRERKTITYFAEGEYKKQDGDLWAFDNQDEVPVVLMDLSGTLGNKEIITIEIEHQNKLAEVVITEVRELNTYNNSVNFVNNIDGIEGSLGRDPAPFIIDEETGLKRLTRKIRGSNGTVVKVNGLMVDADAPYTSEWGLAIDSKEDNDPADKMIKWIDNFGVGYQDEKDLTIGSTDWEILVATDHLEATAKKSIYPFAHGMTPGVHKITLQGKDAQTGETVQDSVIVEMNRLMTFIPDANDPDEKTVSIDTQQHDWIYKRYVDGVREVHKTLNQQVYYIQSDALNEESLTMKIRFDDDVLVGGNQRVSYRAITADHKIPFDYRELSQTGSQLNAAEEGVLDHIGEDMLLHLTISPKEAFSDYESIEQATYWDKENRIEFILIDDFDEWTRASVYFRVNHAPDIHLLQITPTLGQEESFSVIPNVTDKEELVWNCAQMIELQNSEGEVVYTQTLGVNGVSLFSISWDLLSDVSAEYTLVYRITDTMGGVSEKSKIITRGMEGSLPIMPFLAQGVYEASDTASKLKGIYDGTNHSAKDDVSFTVPIIDPVVIVGPAWRDSTGTGITARELCVPKIDFATSGDFADTVGEQVVSRGFEMKTAQLAHGGSGRTNRVPYVVGSKGRLARKDSGGVEKQVFEFGMYDLDPNKILDENGIPYVDEVCKTLIMKDRSLEEGGIFGKWQSVAFSEPMREIPQVFVTIQNSAAQNATIITRIRNITTDGFEVALFAAEPNMLPRYSKETSRVVDADNLVASDWYTEIAAYSDEKKRVYYDEWQHDRTYYIANALANGFAIQKIGWMAVFTEEGAPTVLTVDGPVTLTKSNESSYQTTRFRIDEDAYYGDWSWIHNGNTAYGQIAKPFDRREKGKTTTFYDDESDHFGEEMITSLEFAGVTIAGMTTCNDEDPCVLRQGHFPNIFTYGNAKASSYVYDASSAPYALRESELHIQKDSIVILGPPTKWGDSDTGQVYVENKSAIVEETYNFQLGFQEWNNHDGAHLVTEQVPYLTVPRGVWHKQTDAGERLTFIAGEFRVTGSHLRKKYSYRGHSRYVYDDDADGYPKDTDVNWMDIPFPIDAETAQVLADPKTNVYVFLTRTSKNGRFLNRDKRGSYADSDEAVVPIIQHIGSLTDGKYGIKVGIREQEEEMPQLSLTDFVRDDEGGILWNVTSGGYNNPELLLQTERPVFGYLSNGGSPAPNHEEFNYLAIAVPSEMSGPIDIVLQSGETCTITLEAMESNSQENDCIWPDGNEGPQFLIEQEPSLAANEEVEAEHLAETLHVLRIKETADEETIDFAQVATARDLDIIDLRNMKPHWSDGNVEEDTYEGREYTLNIEEIRDSLMEKVVRLQAHVQVDDQDYLQWVAERELEQKSAYDVDGNGYITKEERRPYWMPVVELGFDSVADFMNTVNEHKDGGIYGRYDQFTDHDSNPDTRVMRDGYITTEELEEGGILDTETNSVLVEYLWVVEWRLDIEANSNSGYSGWSQIGFLGTKPGYSIRYTQLPSDILDFSAGRVSMDEHLIRCVVFDGYYLANGDTNTTRHNTGSRALSQYNRMIKKGEVDLVQRVKVHGLIPSDNSKMDVTYRGITSIGPIDSETGNPQTLRMSWALNEKYDEKPKEENIQYTAYHAAFPRTTKNYDYQSGHYYKGIIVKLDGEDMGTSRVFNSQTLDWEWKDDGTAVMQDNEEWVTNDRAPLFYGWSTSTQNGIREWLETINSKLGGDRWVSWNDVPGPDDTVNRYYEDGSQRMAYEPEVELMWQWINGTTEETVKAGAFMETLEEKGYVELLSGSLTIKPTIRKALILAHALECEYDATRGFLHVTVNPDEYRANGKIFFDVYNTFAAAYNDGKEQTQKVAEYSSNDRMEWDAIFVYAEDDHGYMGANVQSMSLLRAAGSQSDDWITIKKNISTQKDDHSYAPLREDEDTATYDFTWRTDQDKSDDLEWNNDHDWKMGDFLRFEVSEVDTGGVAQRFNFKMIVDYTNYGREEFKNLALSECFTSISYGSDSDGWEQVSVEDLATSGRGQKFYAQRYAKYLDPILHAEDRTLTDRAVEWQVDKSVLHAAAAKAVEYHNERHPEEERISLTDEVPLTLNFGINGNWRHKVEYGVMNLKYSDREYFRHDYAATSFIVYASAVTDDSAVTITYSKDAGNTWDDIEGVSTRGLTDYSKVLIRARVLGVTGEALPSAEQHWFIDGATEVLQLDSSDMYNGISLESLLEQVEKDNNTTISKFAGWKGRLRVSSNVEIGVASNGNMEIAERQDELSLVCWPVKPNVKPSMVLNPIENEGVLTGYKINVSDDGELGVVTYKLIDVATGIELTTGDISVDTDGEAQLLFADLSNEYTSSTCKIEISIEDAQDADIISKTCAFMLPQQWALTSVAEPIIEITQNVTDNGVTVRTLDPYTGDPLSADFSSTTLVSEGVLSGESWTPPSDWTDGWHAVTVTVDITGLNHKISNEIDIWHGPVDDRWVIETVGGTYTLSSGELEKEDLSSEDVPNAVTSGNVPDAVTITSIAERRTSETVVIEWTCDDVADHYLVYFEKIPTGLYYGTDLIHQNGSQWLTGDSPIQIEQSDTSVQKVSLSIQLPQIEDLFIRVVAVNKFDIVGPVADEYIPIME